MKPVKALLTAILILSVGSIKAQKVDSMFVNLYTDSLKKGTFNYINVDGLLSNGRYLPLDSNHLIFKSSAGKFYGNSLWLEKDCREEKIAITVKLKSRPSVSNEFVMYIKKKTDDEVVLKTEEELLDQMRSESKKKKKKDN
jgi:hypothetical protein